ncbi:Cobalt-zinc-cadmium resistance protein [Photobacterium marinum]|uniref:Cobalt-zinc-cadmium resistance protein n=1 Tax=Photobacterium marinum TaxID=1056511 RepID=L8JBQ4_9GAMM|nr:cation transporter [Photobacterium marinum]ELR64832.1 Cobalt-zinc-cadmium resistance protein [Photobacterium marinum]
MSCNVQLERRLLQFSTMSSFLFAIMGIGLGLWMGSLVIVFDGAYSFISLALTVVSLLAAAYIRKPEVANSSHTVAKIEPAVIAFKGMVITVMCCISFYSAVVAIINGGREVDTGLALLFGVINVVGCTATYLVLKSKGQQARSALVEAESKQWVMDTVISGAVMCGFIIATVMTWTGYGEYAAYADPVMVVVASVYFVIVPLKMVYDAVNELRGLSRTQYDEVSELS